MYTHIFNYLINLCSFFHNFQTGQSARDIILASSCVANHFPRHVAGPRYLAIPRHLPGPRHAGVPRYFTVPRYVAVPRHIPVQWHDAVLRYMSVPRQDAYSYCPAKGCRSTVYHYFTTYHTANMHSPLPLVQLNNSDLFLPC